MAAISSVSSLFRAARTLRIQRGRVIDPSQNIDTVADVWIREGRIVGIGSVPVFAADLTMDAQGLLVVPGLVDLHVHLREPGDEADETIESGTRSALYGGITSVAMMPDSDPPIDTQAAAEFVKLQAKRADNVWVWPVGAVTKGRRGEELAELGGLVRGGAVAFSDADRPVASAEVMRRALEYAQMFSRAVLCHPETPELGSNGLINEGYLSMILGLPGLPAVSEQIMADRDIHLAEWTGGRLHLQNLSCQQSVESVRRAKARGLCVTAEVTPHHFVLTEDKLRTFDSNFKVRPPLRTANDVTALIDGLRDGTIDAIASGHNPQAPEKKARELDVAPFGMIGMETLLGVAITALIQPGHLTWSQLVAKMTCNPAQILGIDRGTLKAERSADVTIIDPACQWIVQSNQFQSRSRNCPFENWSLQGRSHTVLVRGEIRFTRELERFHAA